VASSNRPSDRPLLDKLGVKPDARVALVDLDEPWFRELLATRTRHVAVARPRKESDLIFVRVDHRDGLPRVGGLQRFLVSNGAIWVIRPKGSPDIKEVDIIDAGIKAGLVDNKIASFSETLSAMRLVIPLARR
jgi:hypothetical protein